MLDSVDFEQRFLRERPFLGAYLLAATGDRHVADDLLQNVACVLWRKMSDYDCSRPFGAWAAGIAHLEVLKWRQRVARSRETFSEEAMALLLETATRQAEEANHRSEHLVECVKSLRGSARRALSMKYGDGRTIRDIAAQMRRSVGAVEMLLVRSRKLLRQCIERKLSHSQRETS